jgi:hypothetical protein
MRCDLRQLWLDPTALLHQVVIGLDAEPEPLRHAEVASKAEICISRNRALAEDDLIDAAWRHGAKALRLVSRLRHDIDDVE